MHPVIPLTVEGFRQMVSVTHGTREFKALIKVGPWIDLQYSHVIYHGINAQIIKPMLWCNSAFKRQQSL